MQVPFRERLFPGWTWRLPAESKCIAVTFDDGPDPQTTPLLLRQLDRLQIPSTMFILGERVAHNVSLLNECISAGHTLALHGQTHESFFWHSAHWQENSIRTIESTMTSCGLTFQRLFRPPFGHFNLATSSVLKRLKYRGTLWSHIVSDWRNQSAVQLESRLCHGLHSGGILLLHDAKPTTRTVVDALPRLADEVSRRGWRFVTLAHFTTPQRTSQ